MRSIHLAQLDKTRPVVVLTAEKRRRTLRNITIAVITTSVRGALGEVAVGPRNGLDHDCVINCDDVHTIPAHTLGRLVGFLYDDQEVALATAIQLAFDLEEPR